MEHSNLTPVTKTLFFDGLNLIEDGQLYPLGKRENALTRILSVLLQNLGQAVSVETLYQAAFSRYHKTTDYKKTVQQRISQLYKLCPPLKSCIHACASGQYLLDSPGILQLLPQFIRGVTDGGGLFARCACHQQRSQLQMLLETAFTETNAFAICGSPGMGKTELARDFIRACCTDPALPQRLQYRYVIFTTFHKDLKATVENLPAVSACSAAERYRLALGELRQRGKELLLVIDNAELSPEVLRVHNQTYQDLLGTGCHILLTCRRDLDHCPGLRYMELEPLDTAQLKALFRKSAGEDWRDDDALLTTLIETCLQKNTYLVLLAGGLMRSISLEELVSDFSVTGELSDNPAVTRHYKDGRCQESDTLMGHFRRLYNLQALDREQKILLLLLALLPTEGADIHQFFTQAYPKEQQVAARAVFDELEDRNWVFLRFRRVRLHPMIRELVLDRTDANLNSYMQPYLHCLGDKLSHIHFSPALLEALAAGCAAYEAVTAREFVSFATVRLTAQIASVYDTLDDELNAYSYGRKAKVQLDLIDPDALTRQERFLLADCYNVSGCAVSHYQRGEQHAVAEGALQRARELVQQLLQQPESPEEQEACCVLLTKIHGNLGACYHIIGEHRTALAIHQENLQYRIHLQQRYPGKHPELIPAAHKAVATEYFYLAKTENREENLRLSLANHQKAVSAYRQLGPDWLLEHCLAVNRLVGTGVQLLQLGSLLPETSAPQFVAEATAALEANMRYLCTVVPIADALEDCLCRIRQLLDSPCATDTTVAAARNILQLAYTLPAALAEDLALPISALEAALT